MTRLQKYASCHVRELVTAAAGVAPNNEFGRRRKPLRDRPSDLLDDLCVHTQRPLAKRSSEPGGAEVQPIYHNELTGGDSSA